MPRIYVNLKANRRKEIADKRETLKQSIQATMELQRERNSPLNQVVAQINQEGSAIRDELSVDRITRDNAAVESQNANTRFFDCADGVFCDRAGGVR